MSAVYNLEPQPTAKVLLETTAGELLLELFAKQTPLASRNFIQLCLEGYYDGTVFHRLVPGFVIQGGDPTSTGDGGESIYDGGVFEDEFHSRLKFNRRGLLGMANSGRKNDNGSQFFLTLGKTEELTGKNTMFGRIVGDTIYNLMKMGDAELASGEDSERPMYPTKILKTEVLLNPFDDITPRKSKRPEYSDTAAGSQTKKTKKKSGRALLSFAGEEDDLGSNAPVAKKAKFNPKLVAPDPRPAEASRGETKPPTIHRQRERTTPSPPPVPQKNQHPELQLPIRNDESPSHSESDESEPEQIVKVSSLLDRTNSQIAELKRSMKRDVTLHKRSEDRTKSALERMIPESATRGRKRKKGDAGQTSTDPKSLAMVNAFRAKLEQTPSSITTSTSIPKSRAKSAGNSEQAVDNDEEELQLCDLHFIANCQSCASWANDSAHISEGDSDDDTGWMHHTLVFEKDRLGKDLNWKKRNEEELVVIDPREKAKEILADHRSKKSARHGDQQIRNVGRKAERL